ncbi:MAG: hypothetical protein QM778_02225 [Myxococcales bacterium]
MLRASRWVGVVVVLAGCGMFDSAKDPCLSNPRSCIDTGIPEQEQGKIGSPCESEEQCAGALRLGCVDGVCDFAGILVVGDPCKATGECGPNLFCSVEDASFVCKQAGSAAQGARCDATADCQHGLICGYDQGLTKHCLMTGDGDIGASCSSTTDCLAGLLCQPPQSKPGAVDAATSGLTCSPIDPLHLPSTVWDGLVCPPDAAGALSYFRVPRGTDDGDFFRLPFPNDVRRSTTGLDLNGFPSSGDLFGIGVDFVGNYATQASQDLKGFANNPVVYFRFSKPYAGATKDSVLLFDITAGTPEYGKALSRAWGVSNGSVTRYVCENWLNVRTNSGEPLLPSHTYVAILTTGITTNTGAAFTRDGDLNALLSASAPADPALAKAYGDYSPLRAFLGSPQAAGKITADAVLNAAVFTTQDPTTLIKGLRAAVRAGMPASVKDVTLCGPGVTSPCADGGERACGAGDPAYAEIHGRITLPIFQNGEAPYLTTGGNITLDANGTAQVVRNEDVCFGLLLPKTAAPASGYPLVIYGHGTGGSFKSGLNDLASLPAGGAAVLTIDLPQHGSRKNGSTLGSDELFYNFTNPRAARDNVAQGSADLFSLVRWALSASGDAGSAFGQSFRFDATKLAFFGHSQGATHVSLALPYENDVIGAVLSGVGGDLSEALTTKKSPVDIASVIPLVLGDPEAGAEKTCPNCIGSNHPVLALLQSFFEPVDPVNFAPQLRSPAIGTTPKHVFMTYGVGDTYAPETTQQAYSNAAQFDTVMPVLVTYNGVKPVAAPLSGNVEIVKDSFYTQGSHQYQPASGEDGHFVYLGAGKPDWQRFVGGLLSGQTPVIGQ